MVTENRLRELPQIGAVLNVEGNVRIHALSCYGEIPLDLMLYYIIHPV